MNDAHIIYVERVIQCPFCTREGRCAAPYKMRRMPSPHMSLPVCVDDGFRADNVPPKDCPLRRDGALILFTGSE